MADTKTISKLIFEFAGILHSYCKDVRTYLEESDCLAIKRRLEELDTLVKYLQSLSEKTKQRKKAKRLLTEAQVDEFFAKVRSRLPKLEQCVEFGFADITEDDEVFAFGEALAELEAHWHELQDARHSHQPEPLSVHEMLALMCETIDASVQVANIVEKRLNRTTLNELKQFKAIAHEFARHADNREMSELDEDDSLVDAGIELMREFNSCVSHLNALAGFVLEIDAPMRKFAQNFAKLQLELASQEQAKERSLN